jgi:hypothetical protein
MNRHRPVILDLWPLYAAGEASPETKALGRGLLRTIRSLPGSSKHDPLSGVEPPVVPRRSRCSVPQDEAAAGGYRSLLTLAMVFSFMAFGRIIQDTSFERLAARRSCATAGRRGRFLDRVFVSLWRMRASILSSPRKRTRTMSCVCSTTRWPTNRAPMD